MAEEANAAKFASSSRAARAASNNNGTGGGSLEGQVKEEVGTLVRSPSDANVTLRAENPTIYQADVIGDEEMTEKPATGGAPAAAGSPTAPTEGEAADAAMPATEDAAAMPAAEGAAAMPPTGGAAAMPPTGDAAAMPPAGGAAAMPPAEAPASPAVADAPMSPEGGEVKSLEGEAAATTQSPAAVAITKTTMAPGAVAGMETSAGPATGSPMPKDPYAIDIPLDKKINKRTQRKLWEEIEKRKPLVPKHVAQHIQKYAKPPFETYNCKFRSKVSSYADSNTDYPEDDNRAPIVPPEIITQPAIYTVSRGDSVPLRCEVKNKDTDAALLWNYSNKTNPSGKDYLLLFADNTCFLNHLCKHYQLDNNAGTLLILNVSDETAGTYFCSYRSASVIHKVYMRASVESLIGPKSIEAGDDLHLECRVSGYPLPEVMWHRQVNETAPKITVGTGSNVTVEHVTVAHSGIYTCTAYNVDGQQSPAARSMHVSVVKGIAAVNPIVNAGENPATINLCCVYGQTKKEAQIRWLKNGKDIHGTNSRYQINKAHKTRSCLTILTAKEEDLGTYTCQFVKELVDPKSPASAQIELTGIPVTPELLQVTSDASKTPVLKWKVKSFSPLTFYQVRVKKPEQTENDWLLQVNKTVSLDNKEEIIEQSLDSVQNGMYDVELVVGNKYGTARLVSNNKVVVDRSGIEVIAEKINSDNNGNGASRSIRISLFCVIVGIILSRL